MAMAVPTSAGVLLQFENDYCTESVFMTVSMSENRKHHLVVPPMDTIAAA